MPSHSNTGDPHAAQTQLEVDMDYPDMYDDWVADYGDPEESDQIAEDSCECFFQEERRLSWSDSFKEGTT